MSDKKSLRFSDRHDLIITGRSDFVMRKRTTAEQISFLFLMAIIIIIGVAVIVYNNTLLAACILVVVGALMYFVGTRFERLSNQLKATEFLNAMFASTLGRHYVFCLIAKRDGEIVYINRPFQTFFPSFMELPSYTMEALLNDCRVVPELSQKILAAVKNSTAERFPVPMATGADKAIKSLQLSIDPVPRPEGFVLLRGQLA